jgi:outer membrane receptor protein involved in Fe transport
VITGSARLDSWRNYDSHNLETTVSTGLPTLNNKPSLPDKEDTVVSPRIAALYHVSDRVSGWGAWSSGFRAPTLTELYRQFSVAGVTTRPNEQLGPETLKGGEAGINIAAANNVSVRGTWFDNRLKDPVSNVTIGVNLVQKQNLGGTRIRGFQSDVEYRFGSTWRFSGGYVYSVAKVTDGGVANAGLVGKFLPQVPKHRGSMQVSYANPRYVTIAAGVQILGRQFDDDLNVRTVGAAALAEAGYDVSTDPGLPKYALVDLMASRVIGKGIEVFFGAQNLFDRVYFVQTNPSSIGTPRLISGGVRVRIVGR